MHGVPVSKAFCIKEDAAAYIKGSFSNKMQMIFDKYFGGDEYIYINKLHLDIKLLPGEIDLIDYEKQLLDLLEKQLQKKAKSIQPQKNIFKIEDEEQKLNALVQNTIAKNHSPADAFLFFIEKGFMPWWCKITSAAEFEQQVIGFFKMMSKHKMRVIAGSILKAGSAALYRLIHQFTNDFKFEFASIFLQQSTDTIKTLYQKINEVAKEVADFTIKPKQKLPEINAQKNTGKDVESRIAFLFWNECMHTIYIADSFQKFENTITKITRKISTSANTSESKITLLQKLIEETKNEQIPGDNTDEPSAQNKETDTASQIFINNAGLVLLHPFLAALFTELDVAKDDKIIDNAKAIACLNYLCGFDEMQPEFEWPIMKILCGMEITETVEHLAELTAGDKLECNALLQQVIDYWIALKQTSIEGLQQTFIQRFGKLVANENGWLLQIEQKTVDILKDRLPWGVSMVKLPWMKQLLTVEW